MSTNEPGLQQTLAEITEKLARACANIAAVPFEIIAVREKVDLQAQALIELRQRVQALENADHAPHAEG
jgi:hypothetical protein